VPHGGIIYDWLFILKYPPNNFSSNLNRFCHQQFFLIKLLDLFSLFYGKAFVLNYFLVFIKNATIYTVYSQMTFKRPSNNRILTFAEIASETKLPVTEVEFLVMKALSLGLVRGAIDQVAQTVQMTWVQPRVLDKNQVS
jgi:PCI domain